MRYGPSPLTATGNVRSRLSRYRMCDMAAPHVEKRNIPLGGGSRPVAQSSGGTPGAALSFPRSRESSKSLNLPGGSPGAGYLLLRGQKKLTEEKAAPAR